MRMSKIDPFLTDLDEWPPDADLICSAMEAAWRPGDRQRRRESRRPHRVMAQLMVRSEPDPVRIYTRDCDATHLAFIAERPMPLGYACTVEFGAPDGSLMNAACVVQRCRECVPGWFEGVLRFNRPIPSLRLGFNG